MNEKLSLTTNTTPNTNKSSIYCVTERNYVAKRKRKLELNIVNTRQGLQRKIKAITPTIKVIQDHLFCYRLKALVRLPISD